MAKQIVKGNTPFKVLSNTFTVGPAAESYSLMYAVERDGEYTAYPDAVPANEVLICNGCTPYTFFKLEGVGTDEEITVVL